MITIAAFLAVLYVAGTLVTIFGIKNAPDAFEDKTGFHLVWQNNHPEIENVACVWEPVPAMACA